MSINAHFGECEPIDNLKSGEEGDDFQASSYTESSAGGISGS